VAPLTPHSVDRERALARLSIGHYMLRRWSLEDDVRNLERLGFRSISLASSKLEAYGPARAIRLLRASSLRVAHLGSYGFFGTEPSTIRRGMARVRRALEHVHRLGGEALFVISGGRDGTPWETAARVYRDAYALLLPEARAAGIRLAIELIHPLRQDLSFINTLADARELARAAGRGGGYVLDLFHSGWERRLLETIRRDARRQIHAVQICDVKRVTLRTMDRALLGRGILPLPAIVRALEQGGYRGWYEAEIISDDLEAMGYERALRQTRAAFVRLFTGARAPDGAPHQALAASPSRSRPTPTDVGGGLDRDMHLEYTAPKVREYLLRRARKAKTY
jgi:sugar phosphate isomerase/epimerase